MRAEEFIKLARTSLHYITNAEEKLLRYAVKHYSIKDEILKFDKNENAIIQAHLIRWIITDPEARNFIDPYGLRIEGAKIEGNLNLDSVAIPFPLVLRRCFFNGDIILTDADTCFLSLEGSSCNFITARGIRVKGSVRLDSNQGENPFEAKRGVDFCGANINNDFECSRGRFINKRHNAFWAKHIKVGGNLSLIGSYINGEANLSGAKIGGNLDCSHGAFINPAPYKPSTQNEIHALDISLAKVNGKACFNSFKVIGHIFGLEMEIGGDFDCTNGRIKHKTGNCHTISIDRSDVGGNVLLCQGFSATGQVRLIGTKIAGDLDCSGGKFDFFNENKNADNALYASRAKVDCSVLLCGSMKEPDNQLDFETKGIIDLALTHVNGSIVVGKDYGKKTSIFNDYKMKNKIGGGGISLEGAKIAGSLVWARVGLTKETTLNLRGATIARLITRNKEGEESWPNLRLDGFVYDHIEHFFLNPIQGKYVKKTDHRTHLNWLGKQAELNPQPQIYEQLAAVLHRSGQDADAVKISMEKAKIKLRPKGSWFYPWNWMRSLWSLIYYITLGYGYKAHRALILSVIVIALGCYIFNKGYNSGIMVPTDKKAYDAFTVYYTDNHEVPPSAIYYIENNKEPPPYIKPLQHYTEFEPLVYSFDAFLPIGKLQQQEKWHPDDHKKIEISIPPFGNKVSFTLRHYLYFFHTPLGWLLTTLGIAGLLQTFVRNK